jgi:hypothetical protein
LSFNLAAAALFAGGLSIVPSANCSAEIKIEGGSNATELARLRQKYLKDYSYPRGFAPQTPLHALSRAAPRARSGRVARSQLLARTLERAAG